MQSNVKPRIDLETRGRQILKGVEVRARHFFSTMGKEAEKHLSPWLRRLELPSRQEVHRLARRIDQLERRWRATRSVQKSSAARRTAVRRGTTIGAMDADRMNSQRYAELFWDEA